MVQNINFECIVWKFIYVYALYHIYIDMKYVYIFAYLYIHIKFSKFTYCYKGEQRNRSVVGRECRSHRHICIHGVMPLSS